MSNGLEEIFHKYKKTISVGQKEKESGAVKSFSIYFCIRKYPYFYGMDEVYYPNKWSTI